MACEEGIRRFFGSDLCGELVIDAWFGGKILSWRSCNRRHGSGNQGYVGAPNEPKT